MTGYQLIVEFVLPIITLLGGWFVGVYRTKQKKEKDVLDNVQQILDIQRSYIDEQKEELMKFRAEDERKEKVIWEKNRSIRKANGCKYTAQDGGCPVLNSEEAFDLKNDPECADCLKRNCDDKGKN